MTTSTHAQSDGVIDYIVCSALWLLAALMIWRGLREELFSSYRPERHYIRFPASSAAESGQAGQAKQIPAA